MQKPTFQNTVFRGHSIIVLRDDLCFAPLENARSNSSPDVGFESKNVALSGNKARKLYHYLLRDFPNITTVVSYGSAQSNMLYSLSELAKIKGWRLDFYVDHIPNSLVDTPRGNYAAALANGANIIPLDSNPAKAKTAGIELYLAREVIADRKDVLFIPEGGRSEESEEGIRQLADEIEAWISENGLANPKVILPSGTGTTALFLHKHLSFEVLTCPCVGDEDYLRRQFSALNKDSLNHPTILPVGRDPAGHTKKYHFGKLYPELYSLWKDIKEETGITFDLLYDPIGWRCMLDYLDSSRESDSRRPDIIYVHQGGIKGNETMIPRYERMLTRLL